jgi:Tol biopolymer transport system component
MSSGQAFATGPSNGTIAFARTLNGQDIWLMNADGTNQRLASPVAKSKKAESTSINTSLTDWSPRWSRDGLKLAFMSTRGGNQDVYVKDFSTGIVTRITTNSATELPGAWSPDGSYLLFTRTTNGTTDLYKYTFSSRLETRLTAAAGNESAPSVSVDGTVAFQSNSTGDQAIFTLPHSNGVVPPEDWRNLTPGYSGVDAHPDWSPDGQSILFARKIDDQWDLYRMPATGEKSETPATAVVTNSGAGTTDFSDDGRTSEWLGSWSPDGLKIVWTGCAPATTGGPVTSTCEIYSADLGSTGQATGVRRLTTNDYTDETPDWAPAP